MLAFGYANWSRGSGAAGAASSHFVLHRGHGDLLRIESANGGYREHRPTAEVESLTDTALQLASDVEDARDTIGDPTALPLRCLKLPDNTRDNQLVPQFLTNYFQGSDSHDVGDFLTQLFDDPRPATPPAQITAIDTPPPDAHDESFETPGGGRYVSRVVGGIRDVHAVRKAVTLGMHVALAGEPGSGKTTLAQVSAPDLIQYTFHGETTAEDIIGRFIPDPAAPSGFAWKDGPLLIAMREGLPFLADELPRAPREVQAVFFSVCDHRCAYVDLANPHIGDLRAAPGFAVIITYNPNSGFGMDDALIDRIAFTITVPTDLDTAAELDVPPPFVKAARALRTRNQRAATSGHEAVWVPTLRSLLKARDIAAEFGLRFAAAALISSCPDDLQQPDVARALEKELQLGTGTLRALTSGT